MRLATPAAVELWLHSKDREEAHLRLVGSEHARVFNNLTRAEVLACAYVVADLLEFENIRVRWMRKKSVTWGDRFVSARTTSNIVYGMLTRLQDLRIVPDLEVVFAAARRLVPEPGALRMNPAFGRTMVMREPRRGGEGGRYVERYQETKARRVLHRFVDVGYPIPGNIEIVHWTDALPRVLDPGTRIEDLAAEVDM